MFRPSKLAAQKAAMSDELAALQTQASKLYEPSKTTQSDEYYAAADAFNAAAISQLGRDNCGFLLMVSRA